MKRNYVAPHAEIYLCIQDVITASVVVKDDDNVVSWTSALAQEDFE